MEQVRKVKIALLGLGTVGTGVWKIIQENQNEIARKCGYEIEVSKILVRDGNKKRKFQLPEFILTTNPEDIFDDHEIKIVVEVMGGIEPAKEYILEAIRHQKHVVTANKALIAIHGKELLQASIAEGVQLYFEASVGGGIPILHAIKDSLVGNQIQEIMGIVNGTTNYILTKMTEEKMDFGTVLKKAQEKGYAEADPTADVEGYDAAYKLAILAMLAFGADVDIKEIYREGISKVTPMDIQYAAELGYAVKLLAIGKEIDGVLDLRVHPAFISKSHPLASVNDVYNGIFVKGNAVGDLMFYGRGAGDLPTGSAVMGDILNILKCNGNEEGEDIYYRNFENKKVKFMEETESEYYIRMMVRDIPGVLGKIASSFGENGVSLSSVIQKAVGDPYVPLVFITHKTTESRVQKAVQAITSFPEVSELSNLIRVENGKQ